MDVLLDAQDKLTNLKALFIGDVNRAKFYFAPVDYYNINIGYILLAYPQLEILKIRGVNCSKRYSHGVQLSILLRVTLSPIKHQSLKIVILESCGISWELLDDFCKLELPTLEYLQLWGVNIYERDIYDSDSKINDWLIFLSTRFSKLKYLGINEHSADNNLAFAIANSPIVENLVELDLSVGGINDIGIEALFNCPAIRQLDTLDISYNSINYEMIEKMNKLDINFICKSDRPYDYRYYPANE